MSSSLNESNNGDDVFDDNKYENNSNYSNSDGKETKFTNNLPILDENIIPVTKYSIKSSTSTFGLRGKSLHFLVTSCCVVGFSLFGYDQGLMSGLITAPQFAETFPALLGDSHHTTVVQGAVTSCYELGCFFGALCAMYLGSRWGRKPLIILGSIIIIIGTFISIFPFRNHWALGHFVIARTLTGFGNGFNTATIPIYQSELSDPSKRGRLVNLEGSFVAVGTFIAYWIDFGLSYANNSVSWRLPISLQILFASFVLIIIIGLPESPRFLIIKDRIQEARYILSQLNDSSINDEDILEEIVLVMDANNRFSKSISIKELFTPSKHQYLNRLLIGSSGQFFQQFTGCNAAIYYSTVLFESTVGLSRRLSLVLGGVFATVYAIFTIPSFFLVDRLGRRLLFLIGAAGQGVAFIIAFACLIDDTKQNAKGAAFGLFLFIAFFAFTMLPMPWVYPPEINSMRTRTMATSASTCTNWLSNFAVVMFTPIFINRSKWGCYLFFAVMNFLYIPIIYFFYPETAGRSLEEIDIIFAKAYVENKAPFIVANELPKLSNKDIEEEGKRLGLHDVTDNIQSFDQKSSVDETSNHSIV
ncbi:sugar transporter-like protein [Pichia californica]|uniref:Sugar transporter-like protein n=1 Tax=Pichia californica TaxID=460514 RepID=A0A9P6WG78_9ASCO|nr:sugar transporter-like protein [[Candida] californica]KAG0686610.1 sugar transporter-like protein [[Candida] californica]